MATWLGHGIAGVAIAKAAGMGPRGMALGFVLASVPDLDLALGLALEGDSDAFHRAWWSHSPAAALFTAAIAFSAYAIVQALRCAPIDRRRGGGYALFVGLVVLSRAVWDFVIINPTVLLPDAETEEQALRLFIDLVFYGAASLILYRLYLLVRRRFSRGAA